MKMLIVGAGVIGTVYGTHIAAAIASVAQNKRPESAVAGHGTA
jgi:ketopantoate reductase